MYTPSPSVYENIWHVRQAPVIVTPDVPNHCPIPDARTRILERRQTDDGFNRNFYLVEVTYFDGQEPSSTWLQSSDNSEKTGTEVETVDASRILHYVSPRELERFENEQFRIEAEAQAIADKVEEEEQIKKRMMKNARSAGRGRGGGMLDRLDIDPDLQTTGAVRGRPRGRGRGRGRPRGSWRGRVALPSGSMYIKELVQDAIYDSEPSQMDSKSLPVSRGEVAETSSDPEEHSPQQTLSGLMRSAFVTNSALPLSSSQPYRSAAPASLPRGHPKVPDIRDVDTPTAQDDGSTSSAAIQLQFERDPRSIENVDSDSDESDIHRSKRRRTESKEPQRTLMFLPSSQIEVSESEDEPIPADPPSTIKAHRYNDTHSLFPQSNSDDENVVHSESEDEDEEADAEEYVVEAITQHYHNDDGRKFYLVKWQGYEDSYDWLPEEDLEGAAELVQEYNHRVDKSKGKARRT